MKKYQYHQSKRLYNKNGICNVEQQRMTNANLSNIWSFVITCLQQEWKICIIISAQLTAKYNEIDNLSW